MGRNPLDLSTPFKGEQERELRQLSDGLIVCGRMNCLRPGDVGSGKALVAANSLVAAVSAGGQEVLKALIRGDSFCALTSKLVDLPGQAYCARGRGRS